MDLPMQRIVLLVLAGLIPVFAYVASSAEVVALVAAVNVLLIWTSVRIATGGSPQPGAKSTEH